MTTPAPDPSRLPKWAISYIADLQRQRQEAVRALDKWCDDQTPAPFSNDEHSCTGEQPGPTHRTRYFQGHKIKVVHAGVELNVLLREDGDNGEGRICLQWNDPKRLCNRLSMVPVSFQSVELIAIKCNS